MRFIVLLLSLSCTVIAVAQPSAFLSEGEVPDFERVPVKEETLPDDPVDRFLEAQPVKAKVAQLMLVTLEGATVPSANDMAFFKVCIPGGVVMPHAFKPETAAGYVNALRVMERASGIPLLIGADLYKLTEATRTIPTAFIQLPSLLSITAAGEEETTRKLGRFMAEHLAGMGFNLHLGPSLMLAPTLDSAAHTLQTFGSAPYFAAQAGVLLFDAFKEAGVVMMPMGYPGGGANYTGRSAAVLTTPRPVLATSDALPYNDLVKHGAKLVHVGNVLVPTLDVENRPASLSPVVMKDILRGDVGFEGVIVAGPLDDEIVQGRYKPEEVAVQALMAGADMLYWGSNLLPAMRAIELISKLVDDGAIPEERIEESLRRVLGFKQEMGMPTKAVSERQAQKISRQKELIEESIQIERRAITLVRNKDNVLPLEKKISGPVGITGVAGVEELHQLISKPLKPVSQQPITTARHIGEIQRFEIERLTKHIKGIRTIICILTDAIRVETQIELVHALKASAPHLVVIYLGNPQGAARLTEADVLLLAYCESIMIGPTMQAMADILLGEGPVAFMPLPDEIRMPSGESRTFNALEILRVPSGRLPITLSKEFPAGSFARYNPETAIKRVEWNFAGKNIKETSVVHTFDAPGTYPVTLTVTDTHEDVQARTFNVIVGE